MWLILRSKEISWANPSQPVNLTQSQENFGVISHVPVSSAHVSTNVRQAVKVTVTMELLNNFNN